jgi:hypothetical protein
LVQGGEFLVGFAVRRNGDYRCVHVRPLAPFP